MSLGVLSTNGVCDPRGGVLRSVEQWKIFPFSERMRCFEGFLVDLHIDLPLQNRHHLSLQKLRPSPVRLD